MKNFQTVVQELLHNHERQRRYIALLTALCMLMAFTVSIILIEPAESMTGELACGMSEHIHNENCFTYTCGLENDASHVHSADCRTLTCGKTEHAHSENCYIHEDEQTAEIMQINSPQFIDNGMPEGDSPSGDENISPQNYGIMPIAETDTHEWFDEVVSAKPESAKEFPVVTNATITVGDVVYSPGDTVETLADNKDADSLHVGFSISYIIYNTTVTEDQPYICYQLPDYVNIPVDLFGEKYTVTDNGDVVGYYSINQDGLIVIRFTKEYITEKINKADSSAEIPGFISFDAYIQRANTADGDRIVDVEGQQITVQFGDRNEYSITKDGGYSNATSPEQVPTAKWNITVSSYGNTSKFTGMKVKDARFPANGEGVTLKDENGNPLSISDYGIFKQDNSDGSWYFEFTNDTAANTVVFSFSEQITDFVTDYNADFNVTKTNTATLLDSSDKKVNSDDATVTFNNKPTITKVGTADYEYAESPNYEGKIRWTVTVTQPYGTSLNGYTIEDEMFKNEDISVTIKNKNGETLSKGTDYEIKDGVIKFLSDKASKVTITYETTVGKNFTGDNKDSIPVKNQAVLKYPDNPTEPKIDVTKEYVNQQQMQGKEGTYDYATQKITWKVGANVKDSTKSFITLDGYTLKDEAFKYLTEENIKEITATDENNNTLTGTISEDGKKIDFGNDRYIEIKDNTLTVHGNLHSFTMQYQTDKNQANNTGSADGTKTKNEGGKDYVSNKVEDGFGRSSTKDVDVTPRNQVTKSFVSASDVSDEKNGYWYVDKESSDAVSRTLNWQIDVIQDTGFNGNLTDTVTGTVSGTSHYLNKDSVHLTFSTDGKEFKDLSEFLTSGETANSFYDITFSPNETNPTSFTISFKEALNGKNIHYVHVDYSSTLTITPNELEFDDTENGIEKLTFGNDVSGMGTSDSSYDVTVKDKNVIDKTSITISKAWRNGKSTVAPDGATIGFCLQRRLGTSGNWLTYIGDGKSWDNEYWQDLGEDASSGSATAMTYTLPDATTKWNMTFENLPQDTAEHNDKYYYRAIETRPFTGYNPSYTQKEQGVNNGTYTITNSPKPSYTKSLIGKDGSIIPDNSSIEVGSLQQESINGKKYYILRYQIYLKNYVNSDAIILEDTLPSGFTLAYDSEHKLEGTDVTDKLHPGFSANGSSFTGMWNYGIGESQNNNFILEGNDKVKFRLVPTTWPYFKYEIKIPVNDLNRKLSENPDGVPIENQITGDGQSDSAKVTITGNISGPSAPEENSLLNKTVQSSDYAQQGKIEYYAYINPEGKDLSNSDEFDVVDVLRLTGWGGKTEQEVMEQLIAGQLKIKVEEIADYALDESGNPSARVLGELDADKYHYTVDYQPSTTEIKDIEYTVKSDSNGYADLSSMPFKAGETIELEIQFESYGDLSKFYRNLDGSWENLSITPDEQKKAKITIKLPDNYKSLALSDDNKSIYTVKYVQKDQPTTTINSSANLILTVPDGTPLKVTYSYIISKNDGTYPTGEEFTASNEISLYTGNYSSNSSQGKTFTMNYTSDAEIGVSNLPKIVKYNIGNVGENLSADFYIAKYEDSVWNFATGTETDYVEDKRLPSGKGEEYNKLNFGDIKTENNGIPSKLGESNIIHIDANKDFKIKMYSGVLYKIIEIKVPEGGYEANDAYISSLKSDDNIDSLEKLLKTYLNDYLTDKDTFKANHPEYYTLLNKFIAVHYYCYGSTNESTFPDDFDEPYEIVHENGIIGIPNNELIDITVNKTWISAEVESGEKSTTLELLWSFTKSATGIPDDVQRASEENLGVEGLDANNPKTITTSEWTWHNLPNGKDDRPIYYYVREIEYKVNNTPYTRNEEDNHYYNNTTEGDYKPTYVGNGTNKDSTITVKNINGLTIIKVWRNSDNSTMTNPPVDSVGFTLYGKKDGEKVKILEDTLSKASNWMYTVPVSKLRDYTDFEVEETPNADGKLYGYKVEFNKNIDGYNGEITVINRNTIPEKIKVTVNKEWLDSPETGQSITVKLYRSTTVTENNGISLGDESLVTGGDISNPITLSEDSWSYTWENLPFADEEGNRYFYYAVERSDISGYEALYKRTDKNEVQSITIQNYKPENLYVEKIWKKSNGDIIQGDDLKNLPDIQVHLYTKTGSASTIIQENPVPVAISESDIMPMDVTHDNLKFYAFGDSITNGFNAGVKYTDYLAKMLDIDGYTNAYVNNNSSVGLEVDSIRKNISSSLDSSYNVVMVIAGTNDLLNTDKTVEEIKPEMRALINTVYSKNENALLLIGTLPRMTALDWPKRTVNGYKYNSWENSPTKESTVQTNWDNLIAKYNTMLSSLAGEFADKNIKIVDLYDVTKDTLDDGVHPNATGQKAIASAFKTEIDSFYSVTGSHDGKDIEVDTSQSGLPSDFFVNGAVNPAYELVSINGESTFTLSPTKEEGTGVIRYKFALPLPKTDSEGNPLTYYVQEVSINGYTTSYDGNGQSPGNDKTPIRIINTAEEVTGLTLEKIWSESGNTTASEDAEPKTPLDRIQAVVKRKIDAEISPFTPDDSNIINETATDSEKTISIGKTDESFFDDLGVDATGLTKIELELESIGDISDIELVGSKVFNVYQHENSKWLGSCAYTTSGNKVTVTSEYFPSPFIGFFTNRVVIKSVTLYYEAKTPVFSVEVKGNTNLLYDPETEEGEQAQIIVKNGGDSATYSIDKQNVIEIGEKGVVTAIGSGTATVTVTGKNGNSGTVTFTVTPTVENVFEEPIEFKDSGDGIWLPDAETQEELKHLDAEDADHNKYYYYVEEVFEDGATFLSGYEEPKYSYNGTIVEKNDEGVTLEEDKLIPVQVINTRKESSTTTMPSTGGNGAKRYYTVGGMLLMLSACGWAMHRRKRVIPH